MSPITYSLHSPRSDVPHIISRSYIAPNYFPVNVSVGVTALRYSAHATIKRISMSTPRAGIHATRIPYVDWAFWDVAGTLVAAEVAYQNDWFDSRMQSIGFWWSLGVVAHVLFQINTQFIRQLGSQ